VEVKPRKAPEGETPFSVVPREMDENTFMAEVHTERGWVLLALDKKSAARLEAEKALLLKKGHPQALELQKELEKRETTEE
jgi:hypothetical protein